MKVLRHLVVLTLLAHSVSAADATAKRPNFSGTWNLDAKESRLMRQGQASVSLVIRHDDPTLRILARIDAELTDDRTYRLDGVEQTTEVMGLTLRVKSAWKGLLLATRTEGAGMTTLETWKLSADGKTLTIDRTLTGIASGKEKLVYRKRPSR